MDGLSVNARARTEAKVAVTKLSANAVIAVAARAKMSIGETVDVGVKGDAKVEASASLNPPALVAGAFAKSSAYAGGRYGGIGIEATAGAGAEFKCGFDDSGSFEFNLLGSAGVGTGVSFRLNIQAMSEDFLDEFGGFFTKNIPNFFKSLFGGNGRLKSRPHRKHKK